MPNEVVVITNTAVLRETLGRSACDETTQGELLDALLQREVTYPGADLEVRDVIDEVVEEANRLVNQQIDEVLHHREVQKQLASWTAIESAVESMNRDDESITVDLLIASKADVVKDFSRKGWNYKTTHLFATCVRARYGTFGGDPILFCATDFALGPGAEDVKLCHALARTGQRAHMPIIANAKPEFFGVTAWHELSRDGEELKKAFNSGTHSDYLSFRKEEYSRYLSLAMLDLASRPPFGPDQQADGIAYVETVKSPSDLTMSPFSFGLAKIICDAFSLSGWAGSIVGIESGGQIGGLYTFQYTTDTGASASTCPTSFPIDDELETVFEEAGMIAPVHKKNSNEAAIFAAPTIQRIVRSGDPHVLSSLADAAKLPNLLIQGQFAHILKVVMRYLIGQGKTPEDVERHLQNWANQFVLTDPRATDDEKAKRPFSKIEIKVEPHPEKPGVLIATATLTPHHRVAAISAKLVIHSSDHSAPASD